MASEKIVRELYAGKYHMVHNPLARGRAPRYLVNDELKPKGVTTILGATLAKDLVGWAVESCIGFLRAKLPVITEADLLEGAQAHVRLRTAGGDTGSEAHAMVENYLKGKEVADGSPEASKAFEAFKKWFEEVTPLVVGVEEVVYSARLNYAGTYDCLLEIDGRKYLCDLKTTNPSRKAPNGVYAENFLQLGAYAAAHEEQRLYELENGGTELEKIEDLMVISAKKNGKLDICTASEIGLTVGECVNHWLFVLKLHKYMNKTTKLLGGR